MTKAPGESPGLSRARRDQRVESSTPGPFARPGVAVAIAAAGFVFAAVLLIGYPPARAGWVGLPAWLLASLDLIVLSAPLVAAVLVARIAARGSLAAALGLRHWRWMDAAVGISIALIVRGLVETIAPTTGSLVTPFAEDVGAAVPAIVVAVVGGVLLSPIVEELFFRGLALRAMTQASTPALGAISASIVSVGVTTLGFVALHVLPSGGAVPLALVVGATAIGLGCGILAAVTDRLGGAVVAHVVFNASGIALLLW